MDDPYYRMIKEHWDGVLKLFKTHIDKKPLILYKVPGTKFYAVPFEDFMSGMSPKDRNTLIEMQKDVISGSHIVVIVRDDEAKISRSFKILLDPEELDRVDMEETLRKSSKISLPPRSAVRIDDYDQVVELMMEIKRSIPIKVGVDKPTLRSFREKGIKVKKKEKFTIKEVIYLGDEGGIGCNIVRSRDDGNVFISSLTHLIVNRRHPLAKMIKDYQTYRKKRLLGI